MTTTRVQKIWESPGKARIDAVATEDGTEIHFLSFDGLGNYMAARLSLTDARVIRDGLTDLLATAGGERPA